MNTVTSADGTLIGYNRTGSGGPLVLVGGACGTEKESRILFRNAATATAAALPNARLVVRHGLGHSKKLDAKAIAATLTEFLTAEKSPAA